MNVATSVYAITMWYERWCSVSIPACLAAYVCVCVHRIWLLMRQRCRVLDTNAHHQLTALSLSFGCPTAQCNCHSMVFALESLVTVLANCQISTGSCGDIIRRVNRNREGGIHTSHHPDHWPPESSELPTAIPSKVAGGECGHNMQEGSGTLLWRKDRLMTLLHAMNSATVDFQHETIRYYAACSCEQLRWASDRDCAPF